jgi:formate/nitrite transporter FocA (FNT family)
MLVSKVSADTFRGPGVSTAVNDESIEEVRIEARREAPLGAEQEAEVAEKSRLHAAIVYEIIQREGLGELARGFPALWWSGLAAGIAIGFSVVAEALLASHLPPTSWRPLVENFGYSVGFLIVILGRQQLFTENTLTAVLPVVTRFSLSWGVALLRLWSIVLFANLTGCLLFAAFIAFSGVLSAEVVAAVTAIGKHMMMHDPLQMFLRGIAAGWLIAALVWMLPSSEGNEFVVITLITYIIAVADFTHVIAGSVEMFFLLLQQEITISAGLAGFLLPTLAGNIFGGAVLFALLSYAQVHRELEELHN